MVSLRTRGVMRRDGGLLLLFWVQLLIQDEDRRASMVRRFLTSTVRRPLMRDFGAGLTYFQASESMRKSPCLMRRMIEDTESPASEDLPLVSDLEWPRNGERPDIIVYCKNEKL